MEIWSLIIIICRSACMFMTCENYTKYFSFNRRVSRTYLYRKHKMCERKVKMMHEYKSREYRSDECATDENYAWNVVQLSCTHIHFMPLNESLFKVLSHSSLAWNSRHSATTNLCIYTDPRFACSLIQLWNS